MLEIFHAATGMRLAYSYRDVRCAEITMIAFGMMGALAVLVFLSVSSEISDLFRRK
jgi:hypothetical protein